MDRWRQGDTTAPLSLRGGTNIYNTADVPTRLPSDVPSRTPTKPPSDHPTQDPSLTPTDAPTMDPSRNPSPQPTNPPRPKPNPANKSGSQTDPPKNPKRQNRCRHPSKIHLGGCMTSTQVRAIIFRFPRPRGGSSFFDGGLLGQEDKNEPPISQLTSSLLNGQRKSD